MENNSQATQNNTRVCPKDCTKCNFMQHSYCAAQMSFYLVEKLGKLEAQLNGIQAQLNDVQENVQPKVEDQSELIKVL